MARIFLFLCAALSLAAESGHDAWLRYAPIQDETVRKSYAQLSDTVVTLDDSPIVRSAQAELVRVLAQLRAIERLRKKR